MTPDFAEFLDTTPEEDRAGHVFKLIGFYGKPRQPNPEWASAQISRMGQKARVLVNTTPTGKVKFASAHDLRRSFGARWATKVMPIVLQQLMRHENIETTMRYYVGQNAEATADAVWEAAKRSVGTFVGTDQNATDCGSKENDVTRC